MDVITPNKLGNFLSELKNQNIFASYNHRHNDLMIYPSQEEPIGVWIDGRIIYRRTFHWTSDFSTSKWSYYKEQDLLDLNIDQYISCSGMASCVGSKSTTPSWQPIPRICTDALEEYSIGFGDLSSKSIGILFGTNYVSADIYFTIDYVKVES